jgi:hypothetical protein
LLERDNASMDIAQVARCLAKIVMSREYQMLDDAKAQMTIVLSPRYQDLVHRLALLGDANGAPRIVALNQTVTSLVLSMEQSPREEREELLEGVRKVIGGALGLSDREIAAARP